MKINEEDVENFKEFSIITTTAERFLKLAFEESKKASAIEIEFWRTARQKYSLDKDKKYVLDTLNFEITERE